MLKSIRIAGVCFVSMLAMSMALAASASATPHWLQCVAGAEKVSPTKYTTNQCTTAAANLEGGWQWNEVTGTENIRSVGETLTLRDTSLGSAVQCVNGENEGSVGPGRFGRITTAKIPSPETNCHTVEGACLASDVEVVEGIHLPWQTELTETEGKLLNTLKGTGSAGGEPGWKIRCKTAAGKITDECESEVGHEEKLLLANKLTESVLLVLATFEQVHKAKCTKAAEVGEVIGSIALLQLSGAGGLRVSS